MESKRSLKLDRFKRPTLNTDQAIDLMLCGNSINGVIITDKDEVSKFNTNHKSVYECSILNDCVSEFVSEETFHKIQSSSWDIPIKYAEMDVSEYILNLCDSEAEIDRVKEEMSLYEERDMIPVLQFLVYLVDYFREHGYIWGVGRGSSVASYCLYLIGVHKIDSIKYKLDIREFLK